MTGDASPPRHAGCGMCGSLRAEEYGFQKNGWPDGDSYLPAAAGKLVRVKDLDPGGGRTKELQRCPECGTYYYYRTDYEYLAGGTEDEQFLTRLTDEQAAKHLD